MKLEALYNAVIVKPYEGEETTYGNIIVPDLGNEKNKLGKVITVGPGYYSATGTWIETLLKEGDIADDMLNILMPTDSFLLSHNSSHF